MDNEEAWLLNEKYNGIKTEDFFSDVKKLKDGEPLAYLIGHTPFLETTIFLDSRPLIPRTETEYWVSDTLKDIRNIKNPHILDLCAGGGCIGVAVLNAIPQAHVDFAEIDTAHHETIKKNIVRNSIDITRTNIFGGNLFENITKQYSYILTNPPYIDKNLKRTDENVITFEPHQALFGGKDGMEIIERIIAEGKRYLLPNGVLVIEHEPEQSKSIAHLCETHGFSVETKNDQYGVLRYSVLVSDK